MDILVLFGIQDEGLRLLVLLRLVRFLKMQRAASLEKPIFWGCCLASWARIFELVHLRLRI